VVIIADHGSVAAQQIGEIVVNPARPGCQAAGPPGRVVTGLPGPGPEREAFCGDSKP